jgi:hypothetical protein
MAVTLAEAMKLTNDPIRAGIIEMFAASSPVLERATFQNINGLAYVYGEEAELPGIAFRGINGTYTESTGIINPKTETLAIAGGFSDTDRVLAMIQSDSVGAQRRIQDAMKVKTFAGFITRNYFNGDTSSTPKGFDGLKVRCTGSQLIDMGATSGGDTLTLAKLDELIDAVDDPQVLYMNKTMRRKVNALVRAAGQSTEIVEDSFGRQLQAYAGIPIGVIKEDETGTDIFPFTEADLGGGSDVCTSIYAVSYGDGVHNMLQAGGGLHVEDLGLLQTAPVFRTFVEWVLGMGVFKSTAAARLQGIKNA